MSAGPHESDDRARWEARYAERERDTDHVPSTWVIRECLRLPADAIIVDLAGGAGRHAVPLARARRTVVVVDFAAVALEAARRADAHVLAVAADVSALPIRPSSVDAVLCVNFLDRSAFPALVGMIRQGGILVYETFTVGHLELVEGGRAHGPRNPAFLLAAGELPSLVHPLAIREYAEGRVHDGAGERYVAQMVAVNE